MDLEPISKAALGEKILAAEERMSFQVRSLWDAIKVPPEKWSEETYGPTRGGFWVVAVIGKKAIWFNDIEDGFNYSLYGSAGKISEYCCDQNELEIVVQDVLAIIDADKYPEAQCPQIPELSQPN
jgi:hypothetical protein